MFWIFFGFYFLFLFHSKLLRLLLKVAKVPTGHQKLSKMGQTSKINTIFFAQRAKKALAESQSPPQELEVGMCSGPYLLVSIITFLDFEFSQKLGFESVTIWIFTFVPIF